MGLINTRNAILTPDCKSLLTCYICLCIPTITGSCQPKPFWVTLTLSPLWPLSPRDRCVASGDHLYSAQYTQTRCGLTWASLLSVSSPGQQMVRTQSGAALAIIAGVISEVKRGQNFHHKKKRHHCYENLRFNTRNVISRSPSQFFYSCVVCCWFRGSFMPFFTQKVLVFSSPINMIAIPSQLRGEFNGTPEIVSQKFF